MNNICEELKKSSSYVRRWLTNQPVVKEESLTDWLLYNVSKNVPSVLYHAFTRHQEARETGADWEWWILFKTHSIRLRVQAKKVSSSKDNYPDLARTNRYGLQIDMFLDGARKANAIVLYALYSAQDSRTMCGSHHTEYDDGVYLAGASRLNSDFISGGRKHVNADNLLSRSVPFSCFACCPLLHGRDGSMTEFFKNYFESELETDKERNVEHRGIHSELPRYISSLLEHRGESVPDWWENEFKYLLQDFNAVLVYDFRNV